jgi:hypothetical protein
MDAYKDDRYDRIGGSVLWAKDKLFGLPSEVNKFYEEGRDLYVGRMDAVLDRVAILVEKGLNEAKLEIAKGRKAIQTKLEQQPANLRKALQQDAAGLQSQFDQLEQSVDDKQNQLIDSLTQKYNEKLQAIDSRIGEMKAANKGLVDAALDAIGGVIKAIIGLKNMLLGVLSRAAAAIKKIIKDPIGFLGNLVAGVKQGFMKFIGNIGAHVSHSALKATELVSVLDFNSLGKSASASTNDTSGRTDKEPVLSHCFRFTTREIATINDRNDLSNPSLPYYSCLSPLLECPSPRNITHCFSALVYILPIFDAYVFSTKY